MGMFDKFKKILFDEDEIEVPVNSDELPERAPKKEKMTGFIDHSSDEVDENPIKEVIVPKEEDKKEEIEEEVKEEVKETKKFDFQDEMDLDFSDDVPSRQVNYDNFDLPLFDDEVDIKKEGIVDSYRVSNDDTKVRREIKDYRKMLTDESVVEGEKKPFTNTPVISPVFGILDKNYKPDEIVDRTEMLNKVNTGVTSPRSFGPVSYNDQPLPIRKRKEEKEEPSLKEDLVELNSTISEMINEDPKEEIVEAKIPEVVEVPSFEDAIKEVIKEEVEPTHTIDDYEPIEEVEDDDDDVIQTSNYDDYEEITVASIEEDIDAHNSIEDAFEETSELESINERDEEESKKKKVEVVEDNEEEPLVDLDTLINKKDDEEDPLDEGLDNTIETDLFNLIDSMYKDDEEE